MGRTPVGKPDRPAKPERNMRYLISPGARIAVAGAIDTFKEAASCRRSQ